MDLKQKIIELRALILGKQDKLVAGNNITLSGNVIDTSNVIPDWNQNDNTKSDYVKNRTHYPYLSHITFEVTKTLVESDGNSWTDTDEDSGLTILSGNVDYNGDRFKAGDTIKVTINGVSYECVAFDDPEYSGYVTIGAVESELLQTHNFRISWAKGYYNYYFEFHIAESLLNATSDTIFSLQFDVIKYQKIDSTYLPEAVGKMTYNTTNGYVLGETFNYYEKNIASGEYSHAEGEETQALGRSCHAEGANTVANTNGSHAEGLLSKSTGGASHAEGFSTNATGMGSHSEGYQTVSSGHASHAEGYYTIAQRARQHVTGQYNIADTTGTRGTDKGDYLEIVGNGERENSRSNAYTLDWSGNAWFSGDVFVGGTSGKNKDAGSAKLIKEPSTTEEKTALLAKLGITVDSDGVCHFGS